MKKTKWYVCCVESGEHSGRRVRAGIVCVHHGVSVSKNVLRTKRQLTKEAELARACVCVCFAGRRTINAYLFVCWMKKSPQIYTKVSALLRPTESAYTVHRTELMYLLFQCICCSSHDSKKSVSYLVPRLVHLLLQSEPMETISVFCSFLFSLLWHSRRRKITQRNQWACVASCDCANCRISVAKCIRWNDFLSLQNNSCSVQLHCIFYARVHDLNKKKSIFANHFFFRLARTQLL